MPSDEVVWLPHVFPALDFRVELYCCYLFIFFTVGKRRVLTVTILKKYH